MKNSSIFKTERTFKQYRKFLIEKLNEYFNSKQFFNTVYQQTDTIYKAFITDLSFVREILSNSYNPRGETPWDPTCLFRSYWLMCQYSDNKASISNWVKKLKKQPFWAILSGFDPNNVPGIGTFYDFEDRLCDLDHNNRTKRIKNMIKPKSKPKQKLKKNQKKPPKDKGVVERSVNRIIRDENKPLQNLADNTLQQIFKYSFVMPSAQRGLLGDINNLAISGDGMVVETGSSPYGIKECDCWQKHNTLKCECPRRFNDPDANWGWDSYREKYVYGYSNYTFVAADSNHDLPLFSLLAQAARHDSVSHGFALNRLRKLYPEFNFSADILDSAHDNYATYDLLDHWDIEPFIALNEKNKGNFKYDPPIDITDDGTPICKAGFKMVNWGFDKSRHRIKWRCPHKVLKSVECPEFNCSNSDYGRTIHTKPKWDKRIFTKTPRNSQKWIETMKKRTSSERRNSQVKHNMALEQDKVRSKSRWLIRILMRDAAIHANAWVKNADINPKQWIKTWFKPQKSVA